MQLIYRGISYQLFPTKLAIVKQEINGKYRGFSCQQPKTKTRTITDIFVLKYRGIEFIKVFYH